MNYKIFIQCTKKNKNSSLSVKIIKIDNLYFGVENLLLENWHIYPNRTRLPQAKFPPIFPNSIYLIVYIRTSKFKQ